MRTPAICSRKIAATKPNLLGFGENDAKSDGFSSAQPAVIYCAIDIAADAPTRRAPR